MSVVNSLAIFWRDQNCRCFSALHFQPGRREQAIVRARKMLAALTQLSVLQTYGAVLNEEVLPIEEARTAPEKGTALRVQFDLYPEKEVNPRMGITYLKFAVPGAVDALIQAVERGASTEYKWSAEEWLLLKREVIPFLCLPNGVRVNNPIKLRRAEFNYLDQERSPRPDTPPIDAAIGHTEEALKLAQKSFQDLKTQKELERVEHHQKRLDLLYTWRHIEKECFDLVETLPQTLPSLTPPAQEDLSDLKNQISQLLPKLIKKPKPAKSISEQINAEEIKMDQHTDEQHIDEEAIVKNIDIIKPSKDEIAVSEELAAQNPAQNSAQNSAEAKGVAMASDDKLPNTFIILPSVPAGDELKTWEDVPPAHYADASMWLARNQIKQVFGIAERSYYRWISRLHELGLNRELSAIHDGKYKLYYRPDVEKTVALLANQRPSLRTLKGIQTMSAVNEQAHVQAKAEAEQPSAPTITMASLNETINALQQQHQQLVEQQTTLGEAIARIETTLIQLQQDHIEDQHSFQHQINSLQHQVSMPTEAETKAAPSPEMKQILAAIKSLTKQIFKNNEPAAKKSPTKRKAKRKANIQVKAKAKGKTGRKRSAKTLAKTGDTAKKVETKKTEIKKAVTPIKKVEAKKQKRAKRATEK